MTDKLMDCIINPIKCKLLLEIHFQEKAMAKHLSGIYNDILQAALYQHLKNVKRQYPADNRRSTGTWYSGKTPCTCAMSLS